jgi:DnaJ family protein C protein 7
LFEAQLQLKMLHGEDIKDLKFGSNLIFISSNDRFRHYVTSPGKLHYEIFSNTINYIWKLHIKITNEVTCWKGYWIGMTVVLFSNKGTDKQVLMMLEQTSKRFPSVNFLKVGLFSRI